MVNVLRPDNFLVS